MLAEAVTILADIPVALPGAPNDGNRITEEDATGLAFEVFLRGRYENAGGLGTYLTPPDSATTPQPLRGDRAGQP